MCMCVCQCVCLWVCISAGAGPSTVLFINTSVWLTVHSGRDGEPWDSLGQRPHKKSLLIYFPPNWKVHAHTWLNHHASTGDGPPLHADETRSQFCRARPSQGWQRKHSVTAHTYTLLNGFSRCAAPDSPSEDLSPPLTSSCTLTLIPTGQWKLFHIFHFILFFSVVRVSSTWPYELFSHTLPVSFFFLLFSWSCNFISNINPGFFVLLNQICHWAITVELIWTNLSFLPVSFINLWLFSSCSPWTFSCAQGWILLYLMWNTHVITEH